MSEVNTNEHIEIETDKQVENTEYIHGLIMSISSSPTTDLKLSLNHSDLALESKNSSPLSKSLPESPLVGSVDEKMINDAGMAYETLVGQETLKRDSKLNSEANQGDINMAKTDTLKSIKNQSESKSVNIENTSVAPVMPQGPNGPIFVNGTFVGYGLAQQGIQPRPRPIPHPNYARPRPAGPMLTRPIEHIPLGLQFRPRYPTPRPLDNTAGIQRIAGPLVPGNQMERPMSPYLVRRPLPRPIPISQPPVNQFNGPLPAQRPQMDMGADVRPLRPAHSQSYNVARPRPPMFTGPVDQLPVNYNPNGIIRQQRPPIQGYMPDSARSNNHAPVRPMMRPIFRPPPGFRPGATFIGSPRPPQGQFLPQVQREPQPINNSVYINTNQQLQAPGSPEKRKLSTSAEQISEQYSPTKETRIGDLNLGSIKNPDLAIHRSSSANQMDQRKNTQRSALSLQDDLMLQASSSKVQSFAAEEGSETDSDAMGSGSVTASLDERPTFQTISRMKPAVDEQFNAKQELMKIRYTASTTNDPKTQFEYAKACLRYGEEYADEGFAILKRLASTGYPEALYFLGEAFADDGEDSMAYKHYLMAAKRGYAPGCFAIGKCAELGSGCKKSNRLSLEMYTKAATLGSLDAMYRMGLAELHGELGLRPDVFKAAKWFKRAAAVPSREHPEPLYELSKIYEEGAPPYIVQDFAYARGVLMEAADFGYPPAIYKLGYCYEHGLMGLDQNPPESIRLYSLALQANHTEALLGMAGWHMTGAEGLLPKNETIAYSLVREAASKGLARAQYTLGYFCEEGIGCMKDLELALEFYGMAAAQGDERSIARLEKLGKRGQYPKKKKATNSMFGFFKN